MSPIGLAVMPVQALFAHSSASTPGIAWKVGIANGSCPSGGTTESSSSASTFWG